MKHFKKISMIFLNLFFMVGCSNALDKTINFLNQKQVNIFTYKNEYSSLKKINNYKIFDDPSKINISGESNFICVAFSMNDFDHETFYSKDFFENINKSLINLHSYLLLYGFTSLDFLKDTAFDYEPKLGDYSNKEGDTVIYKYNFIYDSFDSMSYAPFTSEGFASFEDTILQYMYQVTYDYEGTSR